jgi:hypothetical protein
VRLCAIAVASILLFIISGTGDLLAETASTQEMDEVCLNWLSVIVHENGSWAGESNPRIVDAREIVGDNGRVLARCYSISPRGYVVVPVLKELPPIKAYSTESNLNVDDEGGMALFLREVLEQRTSLFIDRYGSMEARQPLGDESLFGTVHRAEWNTFSLDKQSIKARLTAGGAMETQSVGPLLTSSWHQRSPYNNFCPMGDGGRCLVGCVATAAAQILNYHMYPPYGIGSESYMWSGDNSCEGSTPAQELSADFSDPYDWANIVDNCGGGCTTAEQNALAELCYEVGVAFHMDYGKCGSGAFTNWSTFIFADYFGYRDIVDEERRSNHSPSSWFAVIQEQINNGYPMMYTIYSHAIVCDGWRINGSLNQYHMNYGWADSHTAWYTVDNLYCSWTGCNALLEHLYRNIIPPCHLMPAGLDFGDVPVGCHVDKSFTIFNETAGVLNGDVTESCDHYEILSGGGPYSLSPGETLLVSVRFAPTAIWTHECTIETESSGCGDVNCRGEGISICDVDPRFLEFPFIIMGDSVDQDFTIYNIGCDTLSGSVSETCDHYEIAAGGGDYALAPGESLVVTVRFKPTDFGPVPLYCTVMTGTDCANVSCYGYSLEPPPACLIEPDTLDFGYVNVAGFKMMTFDITNIGYGTLSGTASDTCPYFDVINGAYALGHDSTHTVTVIFFPGTEGPHECTIETGHAACADLVCVGIGGVEAPACLVDPDTLDFGSITAGDSTDMEFIITNTGGDTLSGDVSETCDHFDIISGGGVFALAAGETVKVTVRYEPASVGTHACTIETGAALCTDVACSGAADDPPLCLIEPDTLSYGVVIVGDSLDMNFDIINAGGGVLNGDVSDTCSCYDVTAGGGAYALSAGETLHVTVRFEPHSDGAFACWIETGAVCGNVYCTGEGDDVSGLRITDVKRFHLYQNYPNPFNPVTNISFTVPAKSHTNLSIYNIEGKLVKILMDGEFEGGVKTVVWNGTDERGNPVSSGVYFYRLRAGGDVMTKKMVLLK